MPTPPTADELLALGVDALPDSTRNTLLPFVLCLTGLIASAIADEPKADRHTLMLAHMAELVIRLEDANRVTVQ